MVVRHDDSIVVDVQDLRKVYHHWSRQRDRQITALKGVSLSARRGEVFGLLGPNGAGKTTLIKILLGVVRPTSGSASLFGAWAGTRQSAMRVGYLPESLRVDRHHTARSALRFYGRLSGVSPGDLERRIDERLELVGLKGRDRESVRRFSKGMYQRLGLAQALLHNPDLLVLDEPTDGLDPIGRSQVRQVLEVLRDEGKTIFLNSHILQEVEIVCSRVAILAAGEIRGMGTISELASQHGQSRSLLEVQVPRSSIEQATLLAKLSDQLGRAVPVSIQDPRLREPSDHVAPLLRIELATTCQRDVDQAVDFLRAQQVSLVSLSIIRPSLEQTFLKLVNRQPVDDGNRSLENDAGKMTQPKTHAGANL
jgi:ABC-2 type transport system ATP-binding protein